MSMVLVDTSIWIDFFKSGKSHEAERLSALLKKERVCIVPIIRAEILSGARTEKEYTALQSHLSALLVLDEPLNLWDSAARVRYLLARKGIQSSLMDLAIAVFAHDHGCELFTRDKEFRQISSVLPLRLA